MADSRSLPTSGQMLAHSQEGLLQQDFDTETSGTTATVALVLHFPVSEEDPEMQGESWLYVANVGDSRAVLVSRSGEDRSEIAVNRLTRDHRPDDLAEAERIQAEGGEVRRLRPGSGTSRIFAPGCQWPAMALSRSLGASIAGTCGVSSEPEVTSVRLANSSDELLVLGTDGRRLFEFCSTKEVATRLCTEGVSDEVLEDRRCQINEKHTNPMKPDVCSVARRRWARSSYNDTVDDITAVAVRGLGERFNRRRRFMCISSIIDFCQSLLRLACQQVLGQPITDQGMPKRKLGELSEPLVESAAATEPAASEQSEGAASSSGAEAASWSLTELNDEVLLQILSSLPGWMAWRLEATGLAAWRTGCTDAWWKTRCHLEFAAERLPAPLAGSTWRQSYRQLLGVQAARTGVWCYSSQRHGLRDRVAAPQLFVNPSGEKLFCYGGWTDGGVFWWDRAQATGTPAMPGGVQSLTPLWAESGTLDAPSRSFVAETASQLRRGGPATAACEEDAALVMAFGGGGGGYRHEHNSWAIGVLREVPGGDTTSILWGRPSAKEKGLTSHTPTPRCAHTATYLPERFTQLAEGAVLLFGGHTAHCHNGSILANLFMPSLRQFG
eukprot:g18190.t1